MLRRIEEQTGKSIQFMRDEKLSLLAQDPKTVRAVRNELALGSRDVAADYARLLRERFPNSSHIEELTKLFRDVTG